MHWHTTRARLYRQLPCLVLVFRSGTYLRELSHLYGSVGSDTRKDIGKLSQPVENVRIGLHLAEPQLATSFSITPVYAHLLRCMVVSHAIKSLEERM